MRTTCIKSLGLAALPLALALAGACPTALADSDESCLECHADAELFEDHADPARLVVTAKQHRGSFHGELGVACVDCHQDLAGVDDFPHEEDLARATCSACHDDVQAVFDRSVHGYALQRASERAPSCASCHGSHDILPVADERSPAYRDNLPKTCAKCHGIEGLSGNVFVKLTRPFDGYSRSVHGRGNGAGEGVAASCADCHASHDVRGHADPQSRVNRANIFNTCGACHADVRDEYEASIHGMALLAGVSDSPTCNDCHGEHLILPADDVDSKVHGRRLATQTCGGCHDDAGLVAKYGLEGGVVGSYVDSYHGWASRRGYRSAATCVSCHTAHAVLPAEHPASSIHDDNLVATCRACHETANARFAASYSHEDVSISTNPINRWIRTFYVALIVGVVGVMLLHNAVILNFYMVNKRRAQAAVRQLRRFDASQITQHMLLMLSFTGLVVTGFALRYPEAWWVGWLTAAGMTEPVRADLHRVFGIVMILVGIYHAYYLAATSRGRRELGALLPRSDDVGELRDNLRYHTWRRRLPARFGRYDYTQKAEYWALVWGTLVMVLTGLVLWVPELAVRWLPVWAITASQTIHFYEAWLATLAIVCWHLFFVIVHPDVYPMSWTWITGKLPTDFVRHHHPRWYEEDSDVQAPPVSDAASAAPAADAPRSTDSASGAR